MNCPYCNKKLYLIDDKYSGEMLECKDKDHCAWHFPNNKSERGFSLSINDSENSFTFKLIYHKPQNHYYFEIIKTNIPFEEFIKNPPKRNITMLSPFEFKDSYLILKKLINLKVFT